MFPNQYRTLLNLINRQIDNLKKSKTALIRQYESNINKQIEKQKKKHKKWFIKNFDFIYNNRHKFSKNTPFANVIIDFLYLYNKSNMHLLNISISDLIFLWDLGFTYHGFPIVEFISNRYHSKLCYMKSNKLINVYGINEKELKFSPLLKGVLDYMCKNPYTISFDNKLQTLDIIIKSNKISVQTDKKI